MNEIYKFSTLCIATAVAVIFKVKAGGNGFVATKTNALGNIHLRRRQIFMIFDPYPPRVGSFLLLSVGKFGQF